MKSIEVVTDKEILSYLLKKRLFPKKKIQITVPNLNTVALKNIIECYLFFSGVQYTWIDFDQNEQKADVVSSFSTFISDVFSWLSHYNKLTLSVNSFKHRDVEYFPIMEASSCLFLRTDHWFGVKSGGSVGHLEGVITGFRTNGIETNVVSSDILQGVETTKDFTLIQPNYKEGSSIPEVPDLLYNFQLQESSHLLLTPKPSFIYQRYSLGNFFGVFLKYKYAVPYVCEYNGSFVWMAEKWNGRKLLHNNLMHKIEMLNLVHADVVVVVSEVMKEELLQRGINDNKILVNPNGVHPSVYSPNVDSSSIKKLYNLEDKFVFGFLGTFGPWHGAEVLTEAFAVFQKKHPELKGKVTLLLVGDGKTMPLVQKVILENSLEDSVILTGLVPQDQGPAYLSACDVLVSPHIQNPDKSKFFGSPTKLFEYMSMSKPIIASDLEQIGEILEHNHTALLTRPGNIDDLVEAMFTLFSNTSLRTKLGEAARKEVISQYSWHDHAKKILNFLTSR